MALLFLANVVLFNVTMTTIFPNQEPADSLRFDLRRALNDSDTEPCKVARF